MTVKGLTMKRTNSRGFTLIEMAMVLLIMGLLLGGGLAVLSSQIESQKTKETQKILEEVKEALIGFAVSNGRLPRPSTVALNGIENPVICASEALCTGLIPWATLGITKLDGWAKVVRYSVTPAYANAAFTLLTTPTKIVQTRNSVGATVTVASQVPAIIFSHGKNNFGTTDTGGAIPNSSTTNLDEIANDTGGGTGLTFCQRTYSENTAAAFGGEFDDIVIWIPAGILFNRLVQAGRLP